MDSNDYAYEVYDLLVLGEQDQEHIDNRKFKDVSDGNFLRRIARETQETAALVTFDYRKVYAYEDNPDETVVGFFHTHPRGHENMSATDVATMKAWSTALGRPLFCAIDCGMTSNHWLGGEPMPVAKGWWCWKDWRVPAISASGDYPMISANGLFVKCDINWGK